MFNKLVQFGSGFIISIILYKLTKKWIDKKKRLNWLTSINIENIMSEYKTKYNDFKFLGAVSIDQLEMSFIRFTESPKTRLGIVINLDESDKDGSHWVACFADKNTGKIYFL